MSDIFDEVDEDLRAERARKLMTRYGGVLVAAAVCVVVAVGGWKAWQAHTARETARVAEIYLSAMRAADGPVAGRQVALADFMAVIGEGGAGYRSLARLRVAAIKADSGDKPGAMALWDQVAGDGAADPLLRDLANLTWAESQIDAGDPAVVAARLRPLASPDNAWHALAEEAQALLDLRQGKKDAARDAFKRLAQDVSAPDGVRGRANGLLSRLGGTNTGS